MTCSELGLADAHLCEEDGLVVARAEVGDVRLVVSDVRRRVVNVRCDTVDRAARALLDEIIEPRGAHGRTAISDGGRNQLRLACERLTPLLPRGNCLCGRHVRLRAQIGLVEAVTQRNTETIFRLK